MVQIGSSKYLELTGSQFLVFLSIFVLVDIQFIGMHILSNTTNYFSSFQYTELLSVKKDRGFPEMYQYFKWQWIACITVALAFQFRSYRYLSWSLLFFYLLFDDALAIHEKAGRKLSSNWDFTPPFDIRLQDVGELAVSAGVGVTLMVLVVLSLYKSDKPFKKLSSFFGLAFVALIFFGIGVDTINGSTKPGSSLKSILVVIEDGGEMIVASIMLAGTFSSLRGFNSQGNT